MLTPEASPSRARDLIRALLRFIDPVRSPSTQRQDITNALSVARKVIVDQVGVPAFDLTCEIAGAMVNLWQKERNQTGFRHARGGLDRTLPSARQYAWLFYQTVFLGLCEGERALLMSKRFDQFAGACSQVYSRLRQHTQGETHSGPSSTARALDEDGEQAGALLVRLLGFQLAWVEPPYRRAASWGAMLVPLVRAKKYLVEDVGAAEESCIEHLVEILLAYWEEVRAASPSKGVAYGQREEASERILAFAQCFYHEYFQGKLGGERALLMQDFETFARGYWFLLLERKSGELAVQEETGGGEEV